LFNASGSGTLGAQRFGGWVVGRPVGNGLSSPANFISSFDNWKSLSLGKSFQGLSGPSSSCAFIKNDGTLWIYPHTSYTSGIFNYSSSASSPRQEATSSTNWKQVSFGYNAMCGIKENGTLWCWGRNDVGQLGNNQNGSTTSKTTPVQEATSSTNWKEVDLGNDVAYAIKTDGSLWAWGSNYDGFLGNGPTMGWDYLTGTITGIRSYSSPIRIGNANDWKNIILASTADTIDEENLLSMTHGYKFVGQKINGSVWGWGSMVDFGFISSSILRPTPVPFNIAAGYVWKTTPTTVSPENFPLSTNANNDVDTAIETFTSFGVASFGIRNNGTLWAWGCPKYYANSRTHFPTLYHNPGVTFAQEWTSSTNWKQISTYISGGYGIKTDGTLWAWSTLNTNTPPFLSGEILPSFTHKKTPYQVGISNNWKQISVKATAAAVKTDGTLWTWGYTNGFSTNLSLLQLNNATRLNTTPTQEFSSATNWQQVSVGPQRTQGTEAHAAAIKTDGTLWTWGFNGSGQLGVNDIISRTTPVQEFTSSTWVQVSCGAEHTVAIKTDGTLWTWGNNSFESINNSDPPIRTSNSGVLGVGGGARRTPVQELTSSTNWKQVSAGNYYNAAIKTDGTLWTWGQNTAAKLGLGNLNGSGPDVGRSTPSRVGTATDWNFVICGAETTLAIKNDGTLWGWGYNGFGGPCGDNSWKSCLRHTAIQEQTLSKWTNLAAKNAGAGPSLYGIKDNGTMWDLSMQGWWKRKSENPNLIGLKSSGWKKITYASDDAGSAIRTDGTLWQWGGGIKLYSVSTGNKHTPLQETSFSNDWKDVIRNGPYIFGTKSNL
jgi:alpha-tubulin suppressor-like RCC1 family protein